MKEYTANCPCCNGKIKVLIDDSGNLSTVFFDAQLLDNFETIKLLQTSGFELGLKGGD